MRLERKLPLVGLTILAITLIFGLAAQAQEVCTDTEYRYIKYSWEDGAPGEPSDQTSGNTDWSPNQITSIPYFGAERTVGEPFFFVNGFWVFVEETRQVETPCPTQPPTTTTTTVPPSSSTTTPTESTTSVPPSTTTTPPPPVTTVPVEPPTTPPATTPPESAPTCPPEFVEDGTVYRCGPDGPIANVVVCGPDGTVASWRLPAGQTLNNDQVDPELGTGGYVYFTTEANPTSTIRGRDAAVDFGGQLITEGQIASIRADLEDGDYRAHLILSYDDGRHWHNDTRFTVSCAEPATTPEELPFTGIETWALVLVAVSLVGVGVRMVRHE